MLTTGARIFVFVGASGSGRKSIAKTVCKDLGIAPIISYTNRPPRGQEQDGVNYHFLTKEQFEKKLKDGEFLQSSIIDGNSYAIAKSDLESALAENRSVYVVVNREASEDLKAAYGERVIRLFIYVYKQAMRERMEEKGTPYDIIERYVERYPEEVTYRKQCEHVFENVELKRTINAVKAALTPYL